MTRKTLRNIIWAAAAALAIASVASGAYHHLVTAGMIFMLGWGQEDMKKEEDRYEL